MFLIQHLSMLSFAVTQKTSQPLQYLGVFGVVQLRGCPQKCCLLRVLEAQKVCQKTYLNPVKLREAFREAFTLTLGCPCLPIGTAQPATLAIFSEPDASWVSLG